MVAGSTLVRVALGGERALSDSRTAINIWVTPQERAFLERIEVLFHRIGKAAGHSDPTTGLVVQDLQETQL